MIVNVLSHLQFTPVDVSIFIYFFLRGSILSLVDGTSAHSILASAEKQTGLLGFCKTGTVCFDTKLCVLE